MHTFLNLHSFGLFYRGLHLFSTWRDRQEFKCLKKAQLFGVLSVWLTIGKLKVAKGIIIIINYCFGLFFFFFSCFSHLLQCVCQGCVQKKGMGWHCFSQKGTISVMLVSLPLFYYILHQNIIIFYLASNHIVLNHATQQHIGN